MNLRAAVQQTIAGAPGEMACDPMAKRGAGVRARIFFWVKIFLTVSVLGLLIVTIKPAEILGSFQGARYPLVFISLALVIPNLGIRAVQWGYILKRVKPDIRPAEIASTLLVGFTFAVVTPGQLGEFGRAFFISGRPRLELIGLSFIDKLYNLLMIVLFGSLGILLLPGLVLGGNAYVFISSCILIAILWVMLLAAVMSPRWIRDLLYAVNVMLPYRDKIKVVIGALDPIYRKHSLVLASLAASHYLISITQYYLLVKSFQFVGIFDAFRAAAATLFTKAALPISIGGLGVGETASVGFFRIFEVAKAVAFNSSMMLFSMNVLLPAVIGLFILLKLRLAPDNNHV